MTTNGTPYAITATKADRFGKSTIIAKIGEIEFRDNFVVDDAGRRKAFSNVVLTKLRGGSRVPTDEELANYGVDNGGHQDRLEEIGRHVLEAVRVADAGGSKPITYNWLTCAQLDSAAYEIEFLVERTLVSGQPCVIAGPKKALKTSFMVDLGLSIATGTPFLGQLEVKRSARVAIMSGESGMATLQETARRVAQAKGLELSEVSDLILTADLPMFGHLQHSDAMREALKANEIEVLFIDPVYLAMPGADAGNLFIQGEMLRSVSELCQESGTMLALCHHTRKNVANPNDPAELEDIAWAGFPEWCRQWLLVSRREKYEPGTGEHRLWLNVGGSAGHSALWAVDVSEGVYDGHTPRRWELSVMRAEEARQEVDDRKEAARSEKAGEKLERDCQSLIKAMGKHLDGETLNVLSTRAAMSFNRAKVVMGTMLDDGRVVPVDVFKSNQKTPREGFKLAPCEDE